MSFETSCVVCGLEIWQGYFTCAPHFKTGNDKILCPKKYEWPLKYLILFSIIVHKTIPRTHFENHYYNTVSFKTQICLFHPVWKRGYKNFRTEVPGQFPFFDKNEVSAFSQIKKGSESNRFLFLFYCIWNIVTHDFWENYND